MSEERDKFVEAIQENNDDPVPRWVYSDWLAEHGFTEESIAVRKSADAAAMKTKVSDIEGLVGQVLLSVSIPVDQEVVILKTVAGDEYCLFHDQDCCEQVMVENVAGNLDDLLGVPLLEAETSVFTQSDPEGVVAHSDDDFREGSWTWTLFRFRTSKGEVTIRWLGTSNGYYSESVMFVCGNKPIQW